MAFKSPFGKYKPKNLNKGSSYTMGNVKSPFGPYTPTKPAQVGGQGQVVVPGSASAPPVQAPDVSWQDSIYNQAKNNIQTGLDNLKGYLVNQETGLGADYGIGFDRDPNDPLQASNFRIDENVDVTNPFSRAALLVRAHKQNVRGNTNSYAARGQLYSGALQNAQNTEQFNYQGGQDALLKDFAGRFGDLYQKWQGANADATQAGLEAQTAAFDRHKSDQAAPAPVNPALIDWFKSNSLKGNQWVEATPQPAPAKPAAKATVKSAQDFFATHVLKGGKWVKKK